MIGRTIAGSGRRTADGRYAARRALPSSGGTVRYAGTHVRTGFPVAIEVPADAVAFDRARAALRGLRHPGHVRLLDVGVLEGAACLVLEHVEGATLSETLRAARRLGPPRAFRVALDLVAALAEAHAHGRVHGDVRPANTTLTTYAAGDQRARLRGHGGVAPPEQAGGHIPPEVRDGAPPSASGDVYALGALLHGALSGHEPRAEAARLAPLGGLVPLPPRLADLVAWATEPDPAARPTTALELLAGLVALDLDEIARFEARAEPRAAVPRAVHDGPVLDEVTDTVSLRTGTSPSVWSLASELTEKSRSLRVALDELGGRCEVRHVLPDDRARFAAAVRAGTVEPPWVVLFEDLTVVLEDPLLRELAEHGETARLLVSPHPDLELTRLAVNAVGVDAHVTLPVEPRAIVMAADRLVERAFAVRRTYDALRLAVRDALEDLAVVERRAGASRREGAPQ